MIEVRVPENQAYDWIQANEDMAQIMRCYTDGTHNDRIFVVDYVSGELSNKDRAKKLADNDWSNQYWAERNKKIVIVWRANKGSIWMLNSVEFLGWLNGFENGHMFEGTGYDVLETYLIQRSQKSVSIAPTWYAVDYDDHESPRVSKKQSYTLPKWAQKLVLRENVTKEEIFYLLSKSWLG